MLLLVEQTFCFFKIFFVSYDYNREKKAVGDECFMNYVTAQRYKIGQKFFPSRWRRAIEEEEEEKEEKELVSCWKRTISDSCLEKEDAFFFYQKIVGMLIVGNTDRSIMQKLLLRFLLYSDIYNTAQRY